MPSSELRLSKKKNCGPGFCDKTLFRSLRSGVRSRFLNSLLRSCGNWPLRDLYTLTFYILKMYM